MFILLFQTIFNDLASIGRDQYHKRMEKYLSSAEGLKAAAAKKKSSALSKLGPPQSNYSVRNDPQGHAPSSSTTNMHHPHQLFNQFDSTTTATETIKRRVSYDPQDYQRSYSYHNSLITEANLAAASIKQMEDELVAARLRVRIMELEAQLQQSSTKADDHQARTSPSQTLSQKNPLSYLASAATIASSSKQEGSGMLGYQYGSSSSNKKQRLS
jgi:hypothetical protein